MDMFVIGMLCVFLFILRSRLSDFLLSGAWIKHVITIVS